MRHSVTCGNSWNLIFAFLLIFINKNIVIYLLTLGIWLRDNIYYKLLFGFIGRLRLFNQNYSDQFYFYSFSFKESALCLYTKVPECKSRLQIMQQLFSNRSCAKVIASFLSFKSIVDIISIQLYLSLIYLSSWDDLNYFI